MWPDDSECCGERGGGLLRRQATTMPATTATSASAAHPAPIPMIAPVDSGPLSLAGALATAVDAVLLDAMPSPAPDTLIDCDCQPSGTVALDLDDAGVEIKGIIGALLAVVRDVSAISTVLIVSALWCPKVGCNNFEKRRRTVVADDSTGAGDVGFGVGVGVGTGGIGDWQNVSTKRTTEACTTYGAYRCRLGSWRGRRHQRHRRWRHCL